MRIPLWGGSKVLLGSLTLQYEGSTFLRNVGTWLTRGTVYTPEERTYQLHLSERLITRKITFPLHL